MILCNERACAANFQCRKKCIRTIIHIFTLIYALYNRDRFQAKRNDTTANIAEILLEQIRSRFDYITNPRNAGFDSIYVTGTYLDPKVALALNTQQIEAAKSEIRRQVDFKI